MSLSGRQCLQSIVKVLESQGLETQEPLITYKRKDSIWDRGHASLRLTLHTPPLQMLSPNWPHQKNNASFFKASFRIEGCINCHLLLLVSLQITEFQSGDSKHPGLRDTYLQTEHLIFYSISTENGPFHVLPSADGDLVFLGALQCMQYTAKV